MGGVPLRNWQNICLLGQLGKVSVFSIHKGLGKQASLPEITSWHHYDIGRSARSQLAKIQRRLQWIRPKGHVYVDWLYTDQAAQQLARVLEQVQPDLVIFEEVWLYRYLPVVQRYGCPTILDNHNIEGVKEEYRKRQGLEATLSQRIRLGQIRAIERAFIRQTSQTWVCSQEDQLLLQQQYGNSARSQIIPNGVDTDSYRSVRQGQMQPATGLGKQPTVLFLAKFSYEPNAEAADILVQQIFPRLCQHTADCQLLLVGKAPTPNMIHAAQSHPNIVVTGQVEDVRPYLAAAQVTVVPLRQGGGTRLKILEAFAAGRPVVSTAKGAEGLTVQDGVHLLLRESAEELADGIIQLWEDADLRSQLAAAAWELVNSTYSRSAIGQKVQAAIAALNLPENNSRYRALDQRDS